MNQKIFALDSAAAGALPARIGERFSCAPVRSSASKRVYHDTFDWRIHRTGGLLWHEPGRGGPAWVWSRPDAPERRIAGRRNVGFASKLAPGTFRTELERVVEMRRLLPVAHVRRRTATLPVLDGRAKTVARLQIVEAVVFDPRTKAEVACLDPTATVEPVRGYETQARGVEDFLAAAGLVPSTDTELALALAALDRRPAEYSSKLRLRQDPALAAGEAVRQVMRALFATMRANEDGLLRDIDTEFLHDFRVAVRRTRTCLGQLRAAVPATVRERFREEFRWLGEITGPLRDLDVYQLKLDDYREELPEAARSGLEPLAAFLGRHRERERRALARHLRGERYAGLVRDWAAFLAPDSPGSEPAEETRPVRLYAADRIGRRFRTVLARGRAIGPATPAAALHRLRIDCKKLRYLLEFFRSLYRPDQVDPPVRELRKLQDALGDFNDLEVQQHALEGFAERMTAEGLATPASLLSMGRLVERLSERQARERERFARRFARFAADDNVRRFEMLGSAAGERTP